MIDIECLSLNSASLALNACSIDSLKLLNLIKNRNRQCNNSYRRPSIRILILKARFDFFFGCLRLTRWLIFLNATNNGIHIVASRKANNAILTRNTSFYKLTLKITPRIFDRVILLTSYWIPRAATSIKLAFGLITLKRRYPVAASNHYATEKSNTKKLTIRQLLHVNYISRIETCFILLTTANVDGAEIR